MKFTTDDVLQYVFEDDVKFIRLAFCDVYGQQKNIAIVPSELKKAFHEGIAIDGSAIAGFGGEVRSDLFLRPDPSTLVRLPWRPESGKVVRMFCDVTYPDGTTLASDTRSILKKAVADAEAAGLRFSFGPEMEFYLFKTDEDGEPTTVPYDRAGYMDIAPADKGENIRRDICLTLEQMGIQPESSHHEEGPGQNEIDFRYSDPLTAADHTITFRNVVNTVAWRSGLWADFSPKPLKNKPGSGMHINFSVSDEAKLNCVIAGVMERIREMTVFMNPVESSYERLGSSKAPVYISWSSENRSQLIRIPAAAKPFVRAELRSADSAANPYLAMALLIYAGIEGCKKELCPPAPLEINLYTAGPEVLEGLKKLPASLEEACAAAAESSFIQSHLPQAVIDAYCKR
ncbi:MAG: glutamine synthetase family protein [Oscillospiraceae bacterium]|nr:glutamine synthetase family protein [Oscillospiraceae bacterium]